MPAEPATIELERFLPYRLSVLSNVVSGAIATAYRKRFDLTIPEWRVLAVLARHPGIPAARVAELTCMDAVAVSRAVSRLLRSGRLRRGVSSDDRRKSALSISRSGAAVYRQVAPLALDFERALIAGMSRADRAALERALVALSERAAVLAAAAQQSNVRARPAGRPAASL